MVGLQDALFTIYKWNRPLLLTYYPLWRLDTWQWHASGLIVDSRYAIDEVAPKDIGKVYAVWNSEREGSK